MSRMSACSWGESCRGWSSARGVTTDRFPSPESQDDDDDDDDL